MRDEIDALEKNGTWTLQSLPKGKKGNWVQMGVQDLIPTRWEDRKIQSEIDGERI